MQQIVPSLTARFASYVLTKALSEKDQAELLPEPDCPETYKQKFNSMYKVMLNDIKQDITSEDINARMCEELRIYIMSSMLEQGITESQLDKMNEMFNMPVYGKIQQATKDMKNANESVGESLCNCILEYLSDRFNLQ